MAAVLITVHALHLHPPRLRTRCKGDPSDEGGPGEKRRKVDKKSSGILITFSNTPAKTAAPCASDEADGDPPRWLHITNLRRPFTVGMLRTTVEQVRVRLHVDNGNVVTNFAPR